MSPRDLHSEAEVPEVVVAEYSELGATIRNGYQLRIGLLGALCAGAVAFLVAGLEQSSWIYVVLGSLSVAVMPLVETVTKVYLAPFVYRALQVEHDHFPEGVGAYTTYFEFRRRRWGKIVIASSGDQMESRRAFKRQFVWRHVGLKSFVYLGASGTLLGLGLWEVL